LLVVLLANGRRSRFRIDYEWTVFTVPDGTFKGTVAYEEATDTALAKVKRLVEG